MIAEHFQNTKIQKKVLSGAIHPEKEISYFQVNTAKKTHTPLHFLLIYTDGLQIKIDVATAFCTMEEEFVIQ